MGIINIKTQSEQASCALCAYVPFGHIKDNESDRSTLVVKLELS